jgi:hypothetical protein
MNAAEKIGKIVETIKSGHTVYVTTATRSTKITPNTLKKWDEAGHELFRASGDSMYMASGNKFVCIDYCKITFAS